MEQTLEQRIVSVRSSLQRVRELIAAARPDELERVARHFGIPRAGHPDDLRVLMIECVLGYVGGADEVQTEEA